jgi:protein SCO1/2
MYIDRDDVEIISFSVDPERDDPERMAYFAGLFNADPDQWHFLTGDKKDIYRMARIGFTVTATDGDGGPDDFIHSPLFVLVDQQKNIRGFYDGTDRPAVNQIIKDIGKLL